MTWIANNLWELMRSRHLGRAATSSQPLRAEKVTPGDVDLGAVDPADRRLPMQQRYDALVVQMKHRFGLRVRKWRSSSSGCAWEVYYRDGSVSRLIESPYPRGPMSCAIFLHEVGHHAIGLGAYKPRCLEEYHAWRWSLEQMRSLNLNVTRAVEQRMHEALYYAVQKASRRGLRSLPAELVPFIEIPQRFRPEHRSVSQGS